MWQKLIAVEQQLLGTGSAKAGPPLKQKAKTNMAELQAIAPDNCTTILLATKWQQELQTVKQHAWHNHHYCDNDGHDVQSKQLAEEPPAQSTSHEYLQTQQSTAKDKHSTATTAAATDRSICSCMCMCDPLFVRGAKCRAHWWVVMQMLGKHTNGKAPGK